MTTTLRRLLHSLRRSWTDGARVERVAIAVGAALFASGLVHLAVLAISGGPWTGPVSLRKPATFGLSFGLTLVTVAWVTHFIRFGDRARSILVGAFTVTSVVEVALVSMQAWRGRPSHFNFETGFDTAVSMTLAFGGFVIVATIIGMTLAAFRAVAELTPAMRLALRFGFVTLVVALGVGAAMIATGSTAARGPDPTLAYTTAGYLKPAHAVTMHAILVIPALAWLVSFTQWRDSRQLRVVQLGVFGYLLLSVVVLIESVTRVSPLDAPAPAMAAAGIGLFALVTAGAMGLYGVFARPGTRQTSVPDGVRQ
jgi:hypothetical protein